MEEGSGHIDALEGKHRKMLTNMKNNKGCAAILKDPASSWEVLQNLQIMCTSRKFCRKTSESEGETRVKSDNPDTSDG